MQAKLIFNITSNMLVIKNILGLTSLLKKKKENFQKLRNPNIFLSAFFTFKLGIC